jgi:hypothetical protein
MLSKQMPIKSKKHAQGIPIIPWMLNAMIENEKGK